MNRNDTQPIKICSATLMEVQLHVATKAVIKNLAITRSRIC